MRGRDDDDAVAGADDALVDELEQRRQGHAGVRAGIHAGPVGASGRLGQLALASLIDDALLLVQRQARLENITIKKVFSPTDLYIVGNSNNLQQVIINVVNNAREAILPGHGEITLKTYVKDGERKRWACIEIDDSGRGIPKDLIERIFDSFFTTKPKGTGLGLSVSKRIIEEHGGKLVAKNIPGGASFIVSLPYSPD